MMSLVHAVSTRVPSYKNYKAILQDREQILLNERGSLKLVYAASNDACVILNGDAPMIEAFPNGTVYLNTVLRYAGCVRRFYTHFASWFYRKDNFEFKFGDWYYVQERSLVPQDLVDLSLLQQLDEIVSVFCQTYCFFDPLYSPLYELTLHSDGELELKIRNGKPVNGHTESHLRAVVEAFLKETKLQLPYDRKRSTYVTFNEISLTRRLVIINEIERLSAMSTA